MADPAAKVPPGLLSHVHLVSQYQFPFHGSPLALDTALEHLLQAPRIVRELSPVAWQFLTPLKDGTLLLMWQPSSHLQNTYATDGYIWADPERQFLQDCKGYKIEILIHETGYIPNVEHVASHRRARYRLVASPTGDPIDPNLEIVHYTQSHPDSQCLAKQIPITPQKQHTLAGRQYLESAGALVRKDFMLHDSNNWPTMSMPTRPQNPQNPYPPAAYAGARFPPGPRPPNQMFPPNASMRPGVGPSPAKRQRQQPPVRAPGAALNQKQEEEQALVDEDSPLPGDFLDFLSPREISFTRYTQHHEWMEEILSSPYSMRQITPVELGLGLTGDLAELTKDLFDEKLPMTTDKELTQGSSQSTELDPEKLEEFDRRISKLQRDSKEELSAMSVQHARKMDEITKDHKTVALLERRLARYGWEPSDGKTMEEITSEVEKATGTKIRPSEEVMRVEKGGLLQAGEETVPNGQSIPNDADELNEFTNLGTPGDGMDFLASGYDSTMNFPT